mgnify:CR=1 FL=1
MGRGSREVGEGVWEGSLGRKFGRKFGKEVWEGSLGRKLGGGSWGEEVRRRVGGTGVLYVYIVAVTGRTAGAVEPDITRGQRPAIPICAHSTTPFDEKNR